MNPRRAAPALVLIALFAATLFFAFNPTDSTSPPDFYVGIEFAYSSNIDDSHATLNSLKALVDKVKGYTNLFIIGLPEISENQTLLTEACDYISDADLSFVVMYSDLTKYDYRPIEWTTEAQQRYGEKFLGAYHSDEPGGKELDNATYRFIVPSQFDSQVRNYTHASQYYVDFLGGYFDYFDENLCETIFTSDYGLYWFDYKGGYDTVFAEFVWNQSRQMAISLCRGAASAQGRDWGAIVTWKYDQAPYIESPQHLLGDLKLAYEAGAKYAVVFNYPSIMEYGIMTQEHFDALSDFWNYVQDNQQKHGANRATAAYVVPEDYGFGFRIAADSIWGLWSADELSSKIWEDTNRLLNQYGSSLDIVYSDPEFMANVSSRYEELYFWNQTVI